MSQCIPVQQQEEEENVAPRSPRTELWEADGKHQIVPFLMLCNAADTAFKK
jgi:hypothetical protein